MKTKKKALLTVLCAAALVFGSVFGTYAYLTDTKEVTNTFTVGNVRITLNEKDVDHDSNTQDNVTVGGVVRDTANKYHLLPGKSYVKDPTIHVDAKSEGCWLFVKVENGIAGIEDSNNTIASQMTTHGWTLIDDQNKIYAYRSIANANDNIVVFDGFKVKGDADEAALTAVKGATIKVTAYAIQAEGFTTAADAWTGASSAFTA